MGQSRPSENCAVLGKKRIKLTKEGTVDWGLGEQPTNHRLKLSVPAAGWVFLYGQLFGSRVDSRWVRENPDASIWLCGLVPVCSSLWFAIRSCIPAEVPDESQFMCRNDRPKEVSRERWPLQ